MYLDEVQINEAKKYEVEKKFSRQKLDACTLSETTIEECAKDKFANVVGRWRWMAREEGALLLSGLIFILIKVPQPW